MTSLATELNRDLSSVSRAAARLRKRMAGDDQLRLKAEKILRVIHTGKAAETSMMPAHVIQ